MLQGRFAANIVANLALVHVDEPYVLSHWRLSRKDLLGSLFPVTGLEWRSFGLSFFLSPLEMVLSCQAFQASLLSRPIVVGPS
jgi:hypothetical protein